MLWRNYVTVTLCIDYMISSKSIEGHGSAPTQWTAWTHAAVPMLRIQMRQQHNERSGGSRSHRRDRTELNSAWINHKLSTPHYCLPTPCQRRLSCWHHPIHCVPRSPSPPSLCLCVWLNGRPHHAQVRAFTKDTSPSIFAFTLNTRVFVVMELIDSNDDVHTILM